MGGARRTEALRARAERGSTSGERKAAQNALDKHLSKARECPSASAWPRPDIDGSALFDEPPPFKRGSSTVTHRARQDPNHSGRVQIEVATNAEMHRRFGDDSYVGLRFMWRGAVHRTTHLRGYVHDVGGAYSRFYVVSHTRDLVRA